MCEVLKPADMKAGMRIRYMKQYRFGDGGEHEIELVSLDGYYYKVHLKGEPSGLLDKIIDADGKGRSSGEPVFCLAEGTSETVSGELKNNDGRTTCAWCGGKIKRVPGISVNVFYDVCRDCGK